MRNEVVIDGLSPGTEYTAFVATNIKPPLGAEGGTWTTKPVPIGVYTTLQQVATGTPQCLNKQGGGSWHEAAVVKEIQEVDLNAVFRAVMGGGLQLLSPMEESEGSHGVSAQKLRVENALWEM